MAWSIEKCDGSTMGLMRPATEDHAEEAIEAVRAGEVIIVPTDTLYGFASDACSMEAVHRIYEIKGQKHTSPLAICVADVQDIQHFATTSHLPQGLLDSLLPGPVTVGEQDQQWWILLHKGNTRFLGLGVLRRRQLRSSRDMVLQKIALSLDDTMFMMSTYDLLEENLVSYFSPALRWYQERWGRERERERELMKGCQSEYAVSCLFCSLMQIITWC